MSKGHRFPSHFAGHYMFSYIMYGKEVLSAFLGLELTLRGRMEAAYAPYQEGSHHQRS